MTATAVEAELVTRVRPLRSRIGPRCASIGDVRSWLSSAAASYFEPERIWSDHSRSKSTAKTASAIAARMATRSAIRGVKRYGSSTLGSGGKKRSPRLPVPVLANDLDSLHVLAPAVLRQHQL